MSRTDVRLQARKWWGLITTDGKVAVELSDDDDVVELLDDEGTVIGAAARLSVHTTQTALHRAFSVHLFDDAGRILLTRRALTKRTWAGVWTNSCCGHPRPGESDPSAIARRVREELGVHAIDNLELVLPDFRYVARDVSGMVENEVCPVWHGIIDPQQLSVDPAEVMDFRWVEPRALAETAESMPQLLSPWAVRQIAEWPIKYGHRPGHNAVPHNASPTLPEAIASVDQAIANQLSHTHRLWMELISPSDTDVLEQDIPDWLASWAGSGGKRIRTAATYWGFVAAGGMKLGSGGQEYQSMISVSAALEMLHLFALLHDDVMDDSDTRRGRPSAHREAEQWHQRSGADGDRARFGRNLSILLGDLAGEAFALRDDLLGIWGDPQLTGKPAGDDLVNGKATVLTCLAAPRLRGAAAVALARCR